jgi:hypothetical protein
VAGSAAIKVYSLSIVSLDPAAALVCVADLGRRLSLRPKPYRNFVQVLSSRWTPASAANAQRATSRCMTWGGLYARDPRIRAFLPLIR